MTAADFLTRHRPLLDSVYAATPAATWGLKVEQFAESVFASYSKYGGGGAVEAYVRALRARDLALAASCACGLEPAWRVFHAELREPLRSAARSIAGHDSDELADSMFGELFEHRAKLASFAGRSSLAGWLRAVLYQQFIDRLRKHRKEVSLEEREEAGAPPPQAAPAADAVEGAQYQRIAGQALEAALKRLPPRQKLLLDFYYFHSLTLREAAALVGVHEATASRELDRARAELRRQLDGILRTEHRLKEDEVQRCLYQAAEGGLDIQQRLQDRGSAAVQK